MPRPSGNSRRSHHYQGKTYRDFLARLSANVRQTRKAAGLTQEEAAHRCGMTTAFFQSIEGEGTNPTGITLARLADGLAVDLADLLRPAVPLPPRRRGRPAKERPPADEEGDLPVVVTSDATDAFAESNLATTAGDATSPIPVEGATTASKRSRTPRPRG